MEIFFKKNDLNYIFATEAAGKESTAANKGEELNKSKGMSGAMKEVYANNKCSRIVLNSMFNVENPFRKEMKFKLFLT